MEVVANWARTIAEQIIIELHLLVGVLPMQITSKGQVTIPQEIRNRLGLLPHTKVEFELAGDHARIRKARRPPGESVRGRVALEVLRGTADTRMRTDEILALTRAKPALRRDGSDTGYHLAGPPRRLPWRARGQQRPA